MKGKWVLIVCFMVFFAGIHVTFADIPLFHDASLQRGHEALNRLYKARNTGEISYNQYLEQAGYMLFFPERLDPRFSPGPDGSIKCGTFLLRDVQQGYTLLSPALQSLFESSLRARPTTQQYYDTPEGNFRLHYDTTGTHTIYQATVDVNPADGVPDFINRAAEAAELVWTEETTTGGTMGLDYSHPPFDGTNGGGTNRYDIYFQALGAGLYGYCQADGSGTGTYPDRPNSAQSFIAMHRDFLFAGSTGVLGAMRVTTAHEFQHACQFAYSTYTDSAWMENCAVNMEENVFDDINDYYGWINPRYQKPHKRLKEFDGQIEYATVIWPMFITQQYGHDIVRAVWDESISTGNIFDAYENVFTANLGLSLQDMYQQFSVWFYCSALYDDGQHYEEGSAWTSYISNGHIRVERTHSSFPASGATPTNAPDRLSFNVIHFDLTGQDAYGLDVQVQGNIPDFRDIWGMTLIGYDDSKGTSSARHFIADATGRIEGSITDPFKRFTRVALLVQYLRHTGTGTNTYSYAADLNTTPPQNVPAMSTYTLILLLTILGSMFIFIGRKRRLTAIAE